MESIHKQGRPGTEALCPKLYEFFLCWGSRIKLPQRFCDAVVITLYKDDGRKNLVLSNHKGIITSPFIVGKILARGFTPSLNNAHYCRIKFPRTLVQPQSKDEHHWYSFCSQRASKKKAETQEKDFTSPLLISAKHWTLWAEKVYGKSWSIVDISFKFLNMTL